MLCGATNTRIPLHHIILAQLSPRPSASVSLELLLESRFPGGIVIHSLLGPVYATKTYGAIDLIDFTVKEMWTNATNGMLLLTLKPPVLYQRGQCQFGWTMILTWIQATASTRLSSPDDPLLSYVPTTWHPEYPRVECLPTPCAPCYTTVNTILRSFPYPIVSEPLSVSVIPYVTVVANGSRITSFVTSTQFDSLGLNTNDIAIQLYETFTWMERNATM